MSRFDTKKFWAVKDGIALAMMPKCGHTSFSRLTDGVRLDNEEVLQYDTRVMFIREPMERFISAYSFFNALNTDSHNGKMQVPLDATNNGYESWVDYALTVDNAHWAPQTELVGDSATHVYKFNCENIRTKWAEHWPGRLPDWLNQCGHLPATGYRSDDIAEYYVRDIQLYARAI